MEATDVLYLLADFRQCAGGQGHGSVFLAFAVMDGEEHGIEVKAVDAQVNAFRQAEAATVQEQNHKTVRRLKVSQDGIDLGAGENDGDVAVALRTDHTIEFTKFSAENVSKEEEERIKSLVLGGGGDVTLDGEGGKKRANFCCAELSARPTPHESLELADPQPVSIQRFG
jgi:hypothetical protein